MVSDSCFPLSAPSVLSEQFSKVALDPSWAFADKTRKDTAYITHGYHRYPAKFIPQIVARLVKKYTQEGDLVVDPFGGCGTTLVEAKVMGRPSIGADINPVAVLMARAKKTALKPNTVEKQFAQLQEKMASFRQDANGRTPDHARIDYWFKPAQKRKLAFLCDAITDIGQKNLRDFFYCGFSNILKNCSIWMQKSNKPMRDLAKVPADPFVVFTRQVKAMLRGNAAFFNILHERKFSATPCRVCCKDARNIPAVSDSARLIVTSPPYVTSYEYADLHQLSALWFGHTQDLSVFRKRFIGTSYSKKQVPRLDSQIAEEICTALQEQDTKKAKEVATYFGEMNQVFQEMHRLLQRRGRACIVIGNTNLRGVPILNAEVFAEQMQNMGFALEDLIKRVIPSKNLPSLRDEATGRFTRVTDTKKMLVYPTEYILVMRKA